MKLKLIVFASLFLVQTLISQNYQTVEEVNDACSQLGFSSNEDAEIAVDDILSQIGLFRNFTIQECPDINNALAKNIDVGDGKKARYILYDKEFFNRIEDKAANDWAATSILAHEIGHHLNGHALNDEGSSHEWELEADEFSGFVMARMGTTLSDAQSAIQTFKYEKATSTHPAKADRLTAIELGWARGSGKIKVFSEAKEVIDIHLNDKKLVAQKIISNYIKAIGGEDNIINMKSLYTKQVISYNDSQTVVKSTSISPGKKFSEYILMDKINYMLELDGAIYLKKNKSDEWGFSSYNPNYKVKPSFVNEHSVLINNDDIIFVGMENFNEIPCYAIRFPEVISNTKNKLTNVKRNDKNIQYYSVETGLLLGIKTTSSVTTNYPYSTSSTDYHNNETLTIFLDYKEYKGILIPSKAITKGNDGSIMTAVEFIEMEVNPKINPKDFTIKK